MTDVTARQRDMIQDCYDSLRAIESALKEMVAVRRSQAREGHQEKTRILTRALQTVRKAMDELSSVTFIEM